jgi:hypothetical protein
VRAGHSSVAFTLDRYGHLYQVTEDDIPERLDALLCPLVRISCGPTAARQSAANLWKHRVGLLTSGFTGGPNGI